MPSPIKPSGPALRALSGGKAAPPSDEEIIEAFEKGDPRFGRQLYDRLVRVVEGTLYRVLGARTEDHEDLVQLAFEQIIVTLARRRFARACSLPSWAAAVTTRLALNTIRSRKTERKYFDSSQAAQGAALDRASSTDTEREVVNAEALAELRRQLSAMSVNKAEAVVLHDVLGHDLAEIAVLTGSSVAAAQSRLVRGRKELQERMRSRFAALGLEVEV